MNGVGSTEPPRSGGAGFAGGGAGELERALVALGRDLDVPETPDVVAAVRARISAPRVRPRRRFALAIALAVLTLLGATLAVPEARSALLRFLHIGGERIERVEELPEVAPGPAGVSLALGEVVTLEEARRRAGFDPQELRGEPAPDRVYLGPRGTVWFLWGTPERARLLVAQTRLLRVDDIFVAKKLVGEGTSVERVAVGGAPGYFLSGEPHFVVLLDRNGNPVEETAWLARNVLVWEESGISIRLEGDFSREEALELARDLR